MSPPKRGLLGLLRIAAAILGGALSLAPPAAAAASSKTGLSVRANTGPPPAIADLNASSTAVTGQALLTWTAPDENSYLPTGYPADFYSVRAATFSVDSLLGDTTAWWNAAPLQYSTSPAGVPGLTETLLLSGLATNNTYYFAVRSLDMDYVSYIDSKAGTPGQQAQVFLAPPGQPPVTGLVLTANALGRSIGLSWTNPPPPTAGVLILRGANGPPAAGPVDGTSPAAGAVIGGATVVFRGAASSFTDLALALNTTWFYSVYAYGPSDNYSSASSSGALLNLRPAVPGDVQVLPAGTTSQAWLSWTGVTTEEDGVSFTIATQPVPGELAGYELFRSTYIFGPETLEATLGASATTYAIALSTSADYYRIVAFDVFGLRSGASARVSAQGDTFVMCPNNACVMTIDGASMRDMMEADPSGGAYVLSSMRTAEVTGTTLSSVEFIPMSGAAGQPMAPFQFPQPKVRVRFYWDMVNGVPVLRPNAAVPDPGQLAIFWFNGRKWIQLGGEIDSTDKSISVMSSMLGAYQLRDRTSIAGSEGFSLVHISGRYVTPNGDGLNDTVVFVLGNAYNAGYSGAIYDLTGAVVATMTPGPVNNSLEWDGKANGRVVPGGIYVYQIRGSGNVVNGTVVIAR